MLFSIIKNIDPGLYFVGPHNSDYLIMLSLIFTDGKSFTKWIIDEIQKKEFKGLAGNIISVRARGDKIHINYDFGLETDTEPIEIDLKDLLRIAQEGLVLMEKQISYIILQRKDENSPIIVTDQLPEGMELFVEHKQLKYRFKN